MSDRLKHRQQKIQEKRKQTPWREFVMEVCSWSPMSYYKVDDVVTIFPPSSRIGSVVSLGDFLSQDHALSSIDYDSVDGEGFSYSFSLLMGECVFPAVRQYRTSINSEYSDTNADACNFYLTRCSIDSKNVFYSLVVKHTENVFDSVKIQGGEGNIYRSMGIDNGFNIFYSKACINCSDIYFSSHLSNCKECIFCSDLQNKTYCIDNIQYSKEEYLLKKNDILHQKHLFDEWLNRVTGSGFYNVGCENISSVTGATSIKNGRNGFILGNPKGVENMYDVCFSGTDADFYGVCDSGGGCSNLFICVGIAGSHSIFYSIFLENCSYCLGCIGLKNKSYCIFNKQYTKEERYNKVDEIFTQMEADGTLGNFFPGSLNPFYFNDTVAYLIENSFVKEEVVVQGYLWRDDPIKVDIPSDVKIISVHDLDQYEGRKDSLTSSEGGEWWVDPEILKVIIQDEQGNVYRIVQMEYDFLMKHGLPLPRKHRLERMEKNLTVS